MTTQTPSTTHGTGRPNVVLMMADDMGWSDLGCYGGEIDTPNLDALGRGGVRLTQFYNTARCSPSRASLLTGLHPHQTGIGELVDNDGPGGYAGSLNERCATLAETLGAAGYRTHMTGKWHMSSEREHPDASWPTRRGFDRFWGTISGAGSYFAPTTLHDGERPVGLDELPEDFYYTEAIGEHAAAAIREDAASGEPFFGYVAFTAPHWPLHARPEDRDRFRGRYAEGWDVLRARRHERQLADGLCTPEEIHQVRDPSVPAWAQEQHPDWQQARMEVYAAQVHAMDRAVGRVLTALDEAGARENTLVVFLADNGGCAEELSSASAAAEAFRQRRYIIPPAAPDGGLIAVGNEPAISPGGPDTYTSYGKAWANLSNTPFRLYKRWVHEGGIATPLIADWPAGGFRSGSLVHAPHQLTDVVPTLLEATGVTAPTNRGGVDLPPLPGVSMLAPWRGSEPVPHPLFWEHIGNAAMRGGRWKLVCEDGKDWELYDIAADRCERHDLAADHPDRVTEMAARWQTWASGVGVLDRDQVLTARRRIAPSRDGEPAPSMA